MANVFRNKMARALHRSTLAMALGVCLASGAAHAQSVTGSIFGNAGTDGGVVVIENQDTGVRFTVTPDANGRYSATQLPTGRYRVVLERDGSQVSQRENVRVIVGQGTEVSLEAADGDETTLAAVVVTASALSNIDVSTVESKLVITREILETVPVAPNLTAVALLAPGAIQGDSRYGNVPVFSGSSASENAYYINGFPVTQSLTQFGYTELPFNAIDQVQISTGGYGVEFGRATGGVVSVITSSGSNEWRFGGQYLWRPESLLGAPKNIHYGPNGRSGQAWGNAGQIFQYRKENLSDRQTVSAYASGPIVKDRLFFFAAGEFIRNEGGGTTGVASSTAAVTQARSNGWTEFTDDTPRWLGKLDWYINDNHHLELTALQDRNRQHDERSGFDYATFERVGDVVSSYDRDRNTRTYIGNYTGYLTDNLTLAAMYGESKTEYEGGPGNYNPDCPSITWVGDAQIPSLAYTTCQNSTAPDYLDGRFDKTKAYRFDVEYRLGDHEFRLGYDVNEATSRVGSANDGIAFPGALGVTFAGGYQWSYFRADDPNEPIYAPQGVGSPASGGGFGEQGYYVVRNIGENISSPRVEQTAYYLKDRWQVTDNVLLELGVRNEQFTNYNSAGVAFIDQKNQWAPRLGATWDVFGDSSTKLYASAGRYHLALPNNVARRGADGATNTSEAFVYTGVDPGTGAPTGLTALGPVYSPNNEFGQPRDARSFAPTSLKAHYQDTFALGIEQNLGKFNAGAKLTYASLGSAIDDFCDFRPVMEWGHANGYTNEQLGIEVDPDTGVRIPVSGVAGFFGHCVLINPGEDNTYQYDIDGDGTYEDIHLTSELLKFPKLRRKYHALDLFVEHPFDGKWYGRVDYTLSKNYGNLEGQLNSDIGQIDVSTTLAGDYWELAAYSYGDLPNDRRHQFKANGYYQVTPELAFSGTVTYASGRPMNCRGAYPNIDPESPNYGSFHFFCNGVPVKRGTYGRLPETFRLDLGARYTPAWAEGLSFGVNIFNVTNRQSVANVAELYNQGTSTTTINANWGRTVSYTAPRHVEFVVRYDWGSGKR